jgi:uncharacterized protein YcbK (DUF882 family)
LAIVVFAACAGLTSDRIVAAGNGDRTISFYHIHTQERLTVTYKKGGSYDADALKKINWIMRDWRKNAVIAIDPATIDLAWEMHQELGSQEPIHIICGFRSRGTNEMLRRKVGGQASQSQHITGKAIDITFPDVPLKRMRYSALIRERGGVGYYPTSGIPFVHIDTARVRSWPRLPRYELALLFPEGRTRHMPADGGPISKSDVQVAKSKHYELSVQIAQFWKDRFSRKAGTAVASADPVPAKSLTVASLTDTGPASSAVKSAQSANAPQLEWRATPQAAARETEKVVQLPKQVASLTPTALPTPKPKLVTAPKMVERPSKFAPAPSATDRSKLAALAQKAADMPMPKLVAGPAPAVRPQKALAAVALRDEGQGSPAPAQKGPILAALMPERMANSITDMDPETVGNGWVQAPEFDEDHPEELAYRPFPLAPMLSDTVTGLDPEVTKLEHPDVAKTLEMIDDIGAVAPMKLRPGQQVAQVLWAQQFQGKAVHLDALKELDRQPDASGIQNRQVQTSSR